MATKKSELLNVQVLDELFPTSITINGHKVEVRSYKEVAGHDDSLPYQAYVYVDEKKCAVVYNDGWGGETSLSVTDAKAYPVINEIEKYIRDHKEEFFMSEYRGIKLYYTNLVSICDDLANNCANRQSALKYADKALVVYNPKSLMVSRVTFTSKKNIKLSQLVGEHKFKTLWYDTIAEYEKKGYTILSIKDIFPPKYKFA